MPVNKNAMARYRIIDRMLADPHKDYTNKNIEKEFIREYAKLTFKEGMLDDFFVFDEKTLVEYDCGIVF
jgi:hypothetical protein